MNRTGYFLGVVLVLVLPVGGRSSFAPATPTTPFDDYGNLCWEDEKARLDNFAIHLLNDNATTLGHIIVYDAKHTCRNEAIARARRAKKYLVEHRKVPANRIVWRWGGYQNDTRTTLVIHPAGTAIWPLLPSLPRDEVAFIGNCNRRVRPVKCLNETC